MEFKHESHPLCHQSLVRVFSGRCYLELGNCSPGSAVLRSAGKSWDIAGILGIQGAMCMGLQSRLSLFELRPQLMSLYLIWLQAPAPRPLCQCGGAVYTCCLPALARAQPAAVYRERAELTAHTSSSWVIDCQ